MSFSFRLKLMLTISALIVVILGSSSFLFLQEKEKDLSEGVFYELLNFSELTATKVAQAYDLFLKDDGFVYFKQNVGEIYQSNSAVSDIRLVSFSGEVFFDSVTERDNQYHGAKRIIGDDLLLTQVQAFYPSVFTNSGNIVHFKRGAEGSIQFVDAQDRPIHDFSPTEQVRYFVQPVNGRFAVMYFVNYDQLHQQIADARTRIMMLTLLGILLALLLAYLLSTNFSGAIKKLTIGAAEVAKGNFTHQVSLHTGDELEILANSFNKMASELEESTKRMIEQEKVARELELAGEIQQNILPKTIPTVQGLDLSAMVIPADEVGGDLYDFFLRNENEMMMYLGDVTGHGVPSGIVVSVVNALFAAYASHPDLKQMIAGVNSIVHQKTTKTMFLTLCLLNWKIAEQRLSYVSAGHEQLLHYSAADGNVSLLPAGGIALGMLPSIEDKLSEVDVPLNSGDAILVYSDGLPEAWKNESENYSMARLKRAFSQSGNLSTAEAIKNAMLSDVKEFTAGYKQMDDMTIMVIKKV